VVMTMYRRLVKMENLNPNRLLHVAIRHLLLTQQSHNYQRKPLRRPLTSRRPSQSLIRNSSHHLILQIWMRPKRRSSLKKVRFVSNASSDPQTIRTSRTKCAKRVLWTLWSIGSSSL
jgi:hypothetical protein